MLILLFCIFVYCINLLKLRNSGYAEKLRIICTSKNLEFCSKPYT